MNSNRSMKKTTSSGTIKSSTQCVPFTGDINMLTMYSQATAPEIFDLRCEYEVPRYLDLNNLDEDEECNGTFMPLSSMNSSQYFLQYMPEQRKHSTTGGAKVPQHVTQEEEFFQWFQLSHDFKVNKRFVKVDREQYIIK